MSFIFRRGLSTLIPPKVRSFELCTAFSTNAQLPGRVSQRESRIRNPEVSQQSLKLQMLQHALTSRNNLHRELKGIGATQDAARMQRVVNFYEKLPRGVAPEPKVTGLLSWYQKKYFGKNPSAARKDGSANLNQ